MVPVELFADGLNEMLQQNFVFRTTLEECHSCIPCRGHSRPRYDVRMKVVACGLWIHVHPLCSDLLKTREHERSESVTENRDSHHLQKHACKRACLVLVDYPSAPS